MLKCIRVCDLLLWHICEWNRRNDRWPPPHACAPARVHACVHAKMIYHPMHPTSRTRKRPLAARLNAALHSHSIIARHISELSFVSLVEVAVVERLFCLNSNTHFEPPQPPPLPPPPPLFRWWFITAFEVETPTSSRSSWLRTHGDRNYWNQIIKKSWRSSKWFDLLWCRRLLAVDYAEIRHKRNCGFSWRI